MHPAPRGTPAHAAGVGAQVLDAPALPRGKHELDEGALGRRDAGFGGEDAALQMVDASPQQQPAPLVHQIPVRRVHQIPAGVAAEETGLVEQQAGGGAERWRAAAQTAHADEDYVSLRTFPHSECPRGSIAARSRSRRSSSRARDIRRRSTPRNPRGSRTQSCFLLAVASPVRLPAADMPFLGLGPAGRWVEVGGGRVLVRHCAWCSPRFPAGSSIRIRTRRRGVGRVGGERGVCWCVWY